MVMESRRHENAFFLLPEVDPVLHQDIDGVSPAANVPEALRLTTHQKIDNESLLAADPTCFERKRIVLPGRITCPGNRLYDGIVVSERPTCHVPFVLLLYPPCGRWMLSSPPIVSSWGPWHIPERREPPAGSS